MRMMRAATLVLVAACTAEPAAPTWEPLLTKSWMLAPGGENTSDTYFTELDRDVYVAGIRPIAPPGTHHTLLARATTGSVLYASGVGTNELLFPPGVGLKLAAGTLLGLQLHVFNVTDEPLGGTSGVEVLVVQPEDIVDEAELLLSGPLELALPPEQTTTLSGSCTLTRPQTIFALFPHMHQMGTHFKTTLTTGGTTRVLHDAPYAFDEQAFLSLEPIPLAMGDVITSECTWTNPTKSTVIWGESSTTEMCFSIIYRYPLLGGIFCDDASR